ncbi:MAG: SDR family oxidoreductase [Calditrichaeota bacterium]|nr:MAG: SDR family oxidoreductase [Calditrichota bacterium]
MILIVGATGQLGSMIVHKLLAQNKKVRAFVRRTSDFEMLQKAGAEIVFGDLKEPETLLPAFEGVNRVVTTASATMRGGADNIDTVDLQGTHDLIDAAIQAKVEQFVYVSAFGLTSDIPMALAKAKSQNEAHLKNSGLNYTILQPVNFMEAWIGFVIGAQLQKEPTVTIVGDGTVKIGFVAMENVAELAVNVLGHPAAQNSVIPLNGPRSVSYREIIGLIESITGQPIKIRSVAPGEPVPGMPPIVNELWAILTQKGDLQLDSTEVAKTYNLHLISVEDFIEKMFKSSR